MNQSNSDPFGFNVIGMASGNVGIGRATRELIRALLARGEAVCVFDTATAHRLGDSEELTMRLQSPNQTSCLLL